MSTDPVYTFAAEHDMPVTIHSDISSVWVKDPIYLHEMEAVVKKHPKKHCIWPHAGMSRRMNISALVPELRRLLKAYPNLWIDRSWVVYPNQVAPDNNPNQTWITLVEEFPDKFMIGTDMIGHVWNI